MIVLALLLAAAAGATLPTRVAVLREGDVWVIGPEGERQVTRHGKVSDFRVSPGEVLLACAVPYSGEPKNRGSLLITRFPSGEVVREVSPDEGHLPSERVEPASWLDDRRLLFYTVDTPAVGDFYAYDVHTGEVELLGELGSNLLDGHVSPHGTLYCTSSGLGPSFQHELHLKKDGQDRLLTHRRSLMDPRFSHAGDRIAFAEVTARPGGYEDRYWVLDVSSGRQTELLRREAVGKPGGEPLFDWSTDDALLAILGGETLIVGARDGHEVARVRASDFCWVGPRQAVLSAWMPDTPARQSLYLYDVEAKASTLVSAGASRPRCLGP